MRNDADASRSHLAHLEALKATGEDHRTEIARLQARVAELEAKITELESEQ
jgi:cell division protein FtsB